jgi:hypothetical protein
VREGVEGEEASTNLDMGKEGHLEANDLRKIKFNFNEAELVEALKQTKDSQKLAKGITKHQPLRSNST